MIILRFVETLMCTGKEGTNDGAGETCTFAQVHEISINQSINQSINNFIYPRDHFTKKWSSKEPCTLTLKDIT